MTFCRKVEALSRRKSSDESVDRVPKALSSTERSAMMSNEPPGWCRTCCAMQEDSEP